MLFNKVLQFIKVIPALELFNWPNRALFENDASSCGLSEYRDAPFAPAYLLTFSLLPVMLGIPVSSGCDSGFFEYPSAWSNLALLDKSKILYPVL